MVEEVKKVAAEVDSVEVEEAPVEGALVASAAADLAVGEEEPLAVDLVAVAAIQAAEERVLVVVLTLPR